MAVYDFADPEIGEQVFEVVTSPCRFCPIKRGCKCIQGGKACIERLMPWCGEGDRK